MQPLQPSNGLFCPLMNSDLPLRTYGGKRKKTLNKKKTRKNKKKKRSTRRKRNKHM